LGSAVDEPRDAVIEVTALRLNPSLAGEESPASPVSRPTPELSVQYLLAYMNDLFAADPDAISALCELRVPANKRLLDHPTAVVSSINVEGDFARIGLLGVLNGALPPDSERLALHLDAAGMPTGFCIWQAPADNTVAGDPNTPVS
jgi:hypothetical protein